MIAVIVEVDAVAAAAVANRDTEQYHRVSREKGRNSLFTEKTWFSRDKAKRADTGYRVPSMNVPAVKRFIIKPFSVIRVSVWQRYTVWSIH